jgi:hypothetical protein
MRCLRVARCGLSDAGRGDDTFLRRCVFSHGDEGRRWSRQTPGRWTILLNWEIQCVLVVPLTKHDWYLRDCAPRENLPSMPRSRLECPSGCGFLNARSPVDGRFHCAACGYSACTSQAVDQLGPNALDKIVDGGVDSILGDLNPNEVAQHVLLIADAIPKQLSENFIHEAQQEIVKICEEVEARCGVPANLAVRGNVLLLILNWSGGGRRWRPEPPKPQA